MYNSNVISVINYNTTQQNEDQNSVVANESEDVSMIRTMLNPTPSGSVKGEDSGSPIQSAVNNNHTNCNHNTARVVRNTADVTRDVLEDVQK